MSFANKIVYIAGPITGRLDTYKQEFERAARFLRARGAIVLNPAVLPLGLKSHESYMRICLPMLREADELVLLPGWKDSKGSLLEVAEARRIGMPIHEFVLAPGMKIDLVSLPPAPANDNVPTGERKHSMPTSVYDGMNERQKNFIAGFICAGGETSDALDQAMQFEKLHTPGPSKVATDD